MKKIIVFLSIIIIILILIIIFMFFSNYYNINIEINKKNNITNNETIKKEQNNQIKYDDELKIKTISIKCEDEITNIKAIVTNNTGKTYQNEEIKIVVYLTTGEIKTLPGYFGKDFKTGTTRNINSTTNENLCNYYKIEYIQ